MKRGLSGMIAVLLGLALSSSPAVAQGKNVTLLIHPTVYDITGGTQGVIPNFEKSEGVKVEVVTQPIIQLHEKAIIEWLSGSGRYDVVSALDSYLDPNVASQYLEPLDQRLSQLPGDYQLGDIIPSLFDAVRVGGKVYGIPFQGGAVMLFYRKDLFSKYGIEPPKSFDDLLSAASKLKAGLAADKITDVSPIAFRAKEANVGTQDFLVFFFAAGGNLFESERTKCGLESAAGVTAAKLVSELVKGGMTPKDLLALGRDELIGGFQQGRIAMAPSFAPYYAQFNDPKNSKVTGNVGWTVMPTAAGVSAGRSFKNYWYLVLDKKSQNKEAAFELMTALAAKDAQSKMAASWGFGPVRQSAFESPQVQKTFPHAEDWARAASASANLPQHPEWARIQDIIFEELATVLNGRSAPEQAVAQMCERISPLLRAK